MMRPRVSRKRGTKHGSLKSSVRSSTKQRHCERLVYIQNTLDRCIYHGRDGYNNITQK